MNVGHQESRATGIIVDSDSISDNTVGIHDCGVEADISLDDGYPILDCPKHQRLPA